jgi:phenylalanyl-tRNA synthetase beta chain
MMSIPYEVKEGDDPAFIPGRCGAVFCCGKQIGVFGEISPVVLTAFGLEQPTCAFELDLRGFVDAE